MRVLLSDLNTYTLMTPAKADALVATLNADSDGEVYVAQHLSSGRSQVQIWVDGAYSTTL